MDAAFVVIDKLRIRTEEHPSMSRCGNSVASWSTDKRGGQTINTKLQRSERSNDSAMSRPALHRAWDLHSHVSSGDTGSYLKILNLHSH